MNSEYSDIQGRIPLDWTADIKKRLSQIVNELVGIFFVLSKCHNDAVCGFLTTQTIRNSEEYLDLKT